MDGAAEVQWGEAPKDAPAALARQAAALWPEAAIPGALHIVSTPIGNLADITLRALAVLQQVHAVCCEDTRHSRSLLMHFGIRVTTLAVHEHNEASAIPALLARLSAGESLALVSDAGTPLVSDPGARLVAAVIDAGLRVVPIPGASATLAALVASGIAPHPCTLLGFLARKGKERDEQLALAARLPHAVVLFEAPGRVAETLLDLAAVTGGGRQAVVARELTKHFEELRRGTLAELAAYYGDAAPKGEVVLVLGPAAAVAVSDDSLHAAVLEWRAQGFRPRDIVRMLMDEHGASRNLAYRLAHDT